MFVTEETRRLHEMIQGIETRLSELESKEVIEPVKSKPKKEESADGNS